MQLMVNGKPHEIEAGTSIAALLEQLNLKMEQVAVEHNRDIVARADFSSVMLNPDDNIEIVNFVGGG